MFDVCRRCGRLFTADRPARYCTPTCRQMAYLARRLERDPAYADVIRARVAAYEKKRRRRRRAAAEVWPNAHV